MEEEEEPTSTTTTLTKRVRCDYDLRQQEIMKLRKQNVLNELEILKLNGKSVIFENQELIASKVVCEFKNRKIINVMVLSKTQSGKTGSMCATIKLYLEDTSNLIPIENIYIVTGLSSCEWKEQTKERMPESIQDRVYHRAQLPNTFVDEIKDKRNILIIMDEIQVAAKKGQTIYKTLQKAGLMNKRKLYENDIKILEYTATPDGTIYDLMKWKDASNKILAEVGEGYVSSFDLLQMGRVKQYKDLSGYNKKTGQINPSVIENIREIKRDIDAFGDCSLYHIIRTKNGVMANNTMIRLFKEVFTNDENFITYDEKSEIEDINEILKQQPTRHTFIFIKEMLRCAKTLHKEFLGILYERHSATIEDTVIIQGLVGRDTGYDNNGRSICYTNIASIEKYERLWESNFEDTTIHWHSSTTKYVNGLLSGKNTFNDPSNYDGFEGLSNGSIEEEEEEEPKEPVIKKFKTQKEVKDYYEKELGVTIAKNKITKDMVKQNPTVKVNKIELNNLDDSLPYCVITYKDETSNEWQEKILSKKEFIRYKGPGPRKREANEDGYYEATLRSKKRVYSSLDIENEKRHGLTEYRVYPCYKNVQDKSSVEWYVIHY